VEPKEAPSESGSQTRTPGRRPSGNSPVVRPDVELNGFQVLMDNDPNESHLRPTLTVVDDQGRVVGFISHPEEIPEVKIVWG